MKGQWLRSMRRLIDANVILRYLLGDHQQMSDEARSVIEKGAFTLAEIIAEVVYVLRGVYSIERNEIGSTLKDFLAEIEIENPEIIWMALDIYAGTSFDYVDCILIARHQLLGEEIVTFDKKLNKMLRSYL